MMFDLEAEIKKCEAMKKEDEEILFAVGAGRIAPKIGMMRAQKKAMKFIQSLEGFIGIYPFDLWHTMLLFDTQNHAKAAKNMLTDKGISCGTYITPVIVKKVAR